MAEASEAPQPNPQFLFSSELASLPLGERKDLARSYIDQFSMRTLDETVVQEAGITREGVKEDVAKDAASMHENPMIHELNARINYCQSILQSSSDRPETYDRMRYRANIGRASVKKITTDETIVVFEQPFFYDRRKNQIRQYQIEEKEAMIKAMQLMNRADSMIGNDKDISMPSADVVGVLYFSKSS